MCDMNIIDIAIIIFLAVGALMGFARGFIKQTTIFVGTIIVLIFAFIFKDTIAMFLCEHLPFLNFGLFKGITSLNILFYEIIGFIIAYIILSLILKIIVSLTGIVERILKLTIVLGLISRVLGMIVGFLQAYVTVYLLLLLLSFPSFNFSIVNESKYKDRILNDTPVLSSVTRSFVNTFSEIFKLKNNPNGTEAERSTLDGKIYDIIVKNGITADKNLQKLISTDKLKVKK